MNNRPGTLTMREMEILKLIAYEYSTKEIANMMCLGFETIKTHRKNILQKLRVRNVAGAVRVAFQEHMLELEDLHLQAS